jgi:hypothetical protein
MRKGKKPSGTAELHVDAEGNVWGLTLAAMMGREDSIE